MSNVKYATNIVTSEETNYSSSARCIKMIKYLDDELVDVFCRRYLYKAAETILHAFIHTNITRWSWQQTNKGSLSQAFFKYGRI